MYGRLGRRTKWNYGGGANFSFGGGGGSVKPGGGLVMEDIKLGSQSPNYWYHKYLKNNTCNSILYYILFVFTIDLLQIVYY